MIELTEEQQERVDIIRHKLKFTEQKPTVACITLLDPFLADGELSELIGMAGGVSAVGDYSAISDQDPDLIILMPKGNTIEDTMRQIDDVMQQPNFTELKAVKGNRFYIADNEQYFQVSAD